MAESLLNTPSNAITWLAWTYVTLGQCWRNCQRPSSTSTRCIRTRRRKCVRLGSSDGNRLQGLTRHCWPISCSAESSANCISARPNSHCGTHLRLTRRTLSKAATSVPSLEPMKGSSRPLNWLQVHTGSSRSHLNHLTSRKVLNKPSSYTSAEPANE